MNSTFYDIIGIDEYISTDSYFGIEDYQNLIIANKDTPAIYTFLSFFIIDNLKISAFPSCFQNEISYLKCINNDESFLDQPYYYPGEYYGISLYEIIKKHGKFPNRTIESDSRDLMSILQNYHSKKFLYRFYKNKGIVFFSESIRPIRVHQFSNIIPLLLDKSVIRLGKENELRHVLNFKSKIELVELVNQIIIDKPKQLNKYNKDQLIRLLVESKDILDTKLFMYFYFLNDNYQELKNWIVKEEIYFKVFCFFKSVASEAYIGLPDLIKDLIYIKNFNLAQKMIDFYFKNIRIFRSNPRFNEEWENGKMKKCVKYL